MSIERAFERAFEKKEKRGWDHIYVFVDIHETIFVPTYDKKESYEYYPEAKMALQMMSKREDIVLGLYTRTYPAIIAKYLEKFEEDGIHFELVNDNSMETSTSYADFSKKPYFNVLIEDNAGFEGETEWHDVIRAVRKRYLIDMMRLDEEAGLYMEGQDGGDGTIIGVDGEKKKI